MFGNIMSLSQLCDVQASDDIYFKFIAVAPVLLIGVFFVAVLLDSYISKKHKKILVAIIFLIFTLILQNYLEHYYVVNDMIFARTFVVTYGYIARPIILALFIKIVCDNWKFHWFSKILILVNIAIYTISLFTGIAFSISVDNHFQAGPFRFTCHIISILLLVQLLYMTIKKYKSEKTSNIIIPLLNGVLIIISIIVDTFGGFSKYDLVFLTTVILACSISYYIWLHHNFVHQHESSLLAEKRIEIMMSQIQPHFILNSLSSISELCKINPNKASQEIDNFMEYLKVNFSALTVKKLVSIEKEIEHVQYYTELEKMRFEDRLEILYDIKCKGFSVPVLSVQPIVENAIRCGVCQKIDGGYVKISTFEDEVNFYISVEDNGVGFDVKCPPVKTDREHIGISNVKERLKALCAGELIINSEIGKGTKVLIQIPKTKG